MPRYVGQDDLVAIQRRSVQRIENQERRVRTENRTGRIDTLRFSTVGNVAVGDPSGEQKSEVSGPVTFVRARLVPAGSTTTTVEVSMNGSVIATINLADSVAEAYDYPDVRVSADVDVFQAEVTAAGTGAGPLVVDVRVKE